MRGSDAVHARAEALAQHRHFRRAAGHAREERRGAIEPGHARQHDGRHVADDDREDRAGREQIPESGDFAHDQRREIEAERRADDPLPAVAHRQRHADVDAGDAQEREREQRPQHPRNRRVQPGADPAAPRRRWRAPQRTQRFRAQRHRRSAAPTRGRSFADAEAPEDDAEQIVRGELAGDRGQRVLRLAQFLGEEFDAAAAPPRHARPRRRGARRPARSACTWRSRARNVSSVAPSTPTDARALRAPARSMPAPLFADSHTCRRARPHRRAVARAGATLREIGLVVHDDRAAARRQPREDGHGLRHPARPRHRAHRPAAARGRRARPPPTCARCRSSPPRRRCRAGRRCRRPSAGCRRFRRVARRCRAWCRRPA